MTGSLYERYGTYYAVLSYKNEQNKKKQKWLPTGIEIIKGNKKKAESKLDELIEQYKYLEYDNAANITEETQEVKPLLTEAIKEWLASKENKIEQGSFEAYVTYVDKHIIPYFEPLNLRIDEVTPKHIKDFYEDRFKNGRQDRRAGGLSVKTIKKIGVVLKQTLNEAVFNEQIMRNPADSVRLPKQDKSEFKGVFMTGEEANKLLQAFAGHELQALIYVTLYYGLRRSEAVGLRWRSVDFDNNTIKIEHVVVKNIEIEYKDRTKTVTSMRTYPLLDDVRELFLKLKEQQAENRKIFKKEYKESDYIFKWQDGRLYRPDYVSNGFQRVLKKYGLKRIRFHDLRHSTASILYDKGWSLKDIQDWLGHADIETTGNIYTHISNQCKQIMSKNLNKLL
jgi:integrase